ncbi:hypothetical protein [Solirubrum puertoriconensis]|uniref:hypothetical protein n=1 Tax=Solirubrum puertoriconensis TaxID=1751427 RepID=UPI00122E7A12|nr:hypothetical protein [Solirubrum puertoriconensis]
MNRLACPLRWVALLPILALLPLSARAQTPRPGSLHTAPGKPLHVQRGKPEPYIPARPPVVLPRFWLTKDSAQQVGEMRRVYSQLMRKLPYPEDAYRQANSNGPPSGIISFRLVVAADGSIHSITIPESQLTLTEAAYPPETMQALENAGKSALGKLLFAPSGKPDTVQIGVNFVP